MSARVRSVTKSSRLSESRRSTSDSASGSTVASRSLHEAANAVARASSQSFLRALPVESTRTRAESLGCSRPPQIRRPLPTSPPGAYSEATSVLHRPTTLWEPLSPAFEGPQTGAIPWEGGTLDELADLVEHRDGDWRFVGIDPDQDLHVVRTHLRFGRTSVPLACVKDIPTSGRALPYFF